MSDDTKVTRLEVIDHRSKAPSFGRAFVMWDENASITLSYQDGHRTLKVFIDDRPGSHVHAADGNCDCYYGAIRAPGGEAPRSCPCEFPEVEACSYACSCRNPVMSGGCRRCTKYGSPEQQLAAAKHLAAPSGASGSENPAEKIFSHKWLDGYCIENGCQSLVSKHRIAELEAALQGVAHSTKGYDGGPCWCGKLGAYLLEHNAECGRARAALGERTE